MEKFDVLVIGSGSGMIVASAAVDHGLKTAVVDSGPMGGTCLNRGCVPSKMLIYPADVVAILKEAEKLGVNATVNSVDFKKIMERMHHQFTSDYTMQVGEHTINAKMIFIASGARPGIPPVKGIENVNYMTSDTVLKLEKPPNSIIIIGGGYIGVEYGHFFSGIGTKTTIIQRPSRILPEEEPEISDLLKREMARRMEIHTSLEVVAVKQEGDVKTVVAKNRENGNLSEFSADALMVATGRVPNSDLLKPEKTGVKLDERGYVKANDYLETSKKNIWAFGDAIGKEMFKHVANYEAGVVWHNAVHDHKVPMDFSVAPHAVFTHPQVASVGLKEAEAKQQGHKILVGKAFYRNTAMGGAMGEPEGFVKVIVEQETGKILGGHIIGAEASVLIQEIVNAMVTENRSFAPIVRAMYIHPSLAEVVQNAFGNLRPA